MIEAYPPVRARPGLAPAPRRSTRDRPHGGSRGASACRTIRARASCARRILYSRDRLHDFDDLARRLLRLLSGEFTTAASGTLPQDTILVARTMGPAELLDYDRQRLRALVLEEAGATSHVAIVARALGIVAISQCKGVVEAVESGDAAIVDAETGELHVRPTQEVVSAYADKVRFRARKQAQYSALRTVPAQTLDGERIALHINAGLLFDLPHLNQSGADGIGLFRTELQFMIAATFPRLEQQTRLYKAIIDAAGDTASRVPLPRRGRR